MHPEPDDEIPVFESARSDPQATGLDVSAFASLFYRPAGSLILTEADDLDDILAWREDRTVIRNLTLRYDRMMLLLDPTPFARELAGKKIEVVNYPDSTAGVLSAGGTDLPPIFRSTRRLNLF